MKENWFNCGQWILERKKLTQREGKEGLMPLKVATAVQKSLGWENTWIIPVFLIKVHRVKVCDHHGAFWDGVAINCCILGGGPKNTQWDNVAEAKDLMENSFYIGHLLFVL